MKKIMLSFAACLMLLSIGIGTLNPAYAEGVAPVAENFEFKTKINTVLNGRLAAYDPEEDIVCFQLTTAPVKGEIKIEADGTFDYTPRCGKKGRDYFGYKAVDSQGNISQEATVIIRIEKENGK